jgi:5-methylcytosine-specific restriction endonuclease McrA
MNEGRRKRILGKHKNGTEKFIWENDCKECGKWFALKDGKLEIDHKEEIGPFSGDWNEYINRMFCDQSNLQRLCIQCHLIKTSRFNSTLRYERKNKNIDPMDYL